MMKQEGHIMQVVLRFRDNTTGNINRIIGSVLMQSEVDTIQYLIGGFYFDTERSPTMILAALEEDGYHFDDFESINFQS